MTIGRICSRTTYTADADETAREAAERLGKENVGTLLVLDSERRPIGILTDRDLALRVVARGLNPERTTVAEIMTTHPRWVREQATIEDALATMRRLGVRRLPVVDEHERLVGVASVDDVLELVSEELGNLGKILGWSHPGITVPAASAPRPEQPVAATSGLERAAADLEC
jgi:CBS-domain-containing membrane protein